jgi:hypothetical protein
MNQIAQDGTRLIDVTGLPEEAIKALQAIVTLLRGKERYGGTQSFASREEWIKAIQDWADSHRKIDTQLDDSRESIYAGRGE